MGGRRPRGAVPGPRLRLGLLPAADRLVCGDAAGAALSTAIAGGVDDDLWSAIGDPTRRRLLDLLLVDGDATATSLSRQLPVTRQAVAKHLGVLDRVGLVRATPAGREKRYRVDDAQLARAVAQLASVGSAWDARLQRIRRIAEAIQRAQQD
ncbi:helix-turn-helix domain-containing protein [Frankia sp. Cpl3]|nr:helix-turn-helix domain-containing protein [Frankia sp. Cpl3]